jgi:bifunctional non-homologous end joining protein LigD
VLWPEDGLTKRDLADYYARMATHVLRFVGGRPLSLVRAPDGIHRQLFFQRHAMKGMSAAITEVAIAGQEKPYLVVRDVAGLAGLAQIAAIELHPWAALADDVERPDYISFDLDPDPDLGFAALKEAAIELRARLEALGLPSFPKLTGGKGLHVVVPLKPRANWDEVKGFARAIATTMESEAPDRFTAVMSKKRRAGRIFVDYLRNGRTATAISCWSPRARAGAPISVPLGWTLSPRRRNYRASRSATRTPRCGWRRRGMISMPRARPSPAPCSSDSAASFPSSSERATRVRSGVHMLG